MNDLLEPETTEYSGQEFMVLYTGMPDGRELENRMNDQQIIEAPETGKLYFTVSENQALNDYVLCRKHQQDYNPVILETWLPENSLEDWVPGAEFTAQSYPVENIRGYTDVETGIFVGHGESWEPETTTEKIKHFLGFEQEPDYLFDEDTEFDPRLEW